MEGGLFESSSGFMASSVDTITGSFQSQTNTSGKPQQCRKRGLTTMLSDATNILPAKRASKEKAVSEIACITAKKAPRGGKHVPEATCLTHAQAKSSGPRHSLCQIATHNHTVYNNGKLRSTLQKMQLLIHKKHLLFRFLQQV